MFLKLIIFILASAGIVWLSLRSLRDPSSHGFYRFFAFESILLLILLNVEYWFDDPLSIHQLVSWVLLIVSGILVVHGFYTFKTVGKPSGRIEDTTALVTVGVYRYIRHPLYASLLYFAWGAYLKQPSVIGIVFVAAATVSLIATAKAEEAEDTDKFGEAYTAYMGRTKMFIPFLF